jgi:hypothetical protein
MAGYKILSFCNQIVNFFIWIVKRSVYYIGKHECPLRLLWLKPFFFALFYDYKRAISYLKPLIKMEITGPAFALQIFGPKFLRDALEVCRELNLKPFLVWGSLLGFVREGGFIKHDSDIDLGFLSEDYIKKDMLKQAMLANGYKMRWEWEFAISFAHPKFDSLGIDYFFVYKKNDQMVMSGFSKTRNKKEVYYFPLDNFDNFKMVTFEQNEVLIPSQAEKFLSVAYGDWQIIKKKFQILN